MGRFRWLFAALSALLAPLAGAADLTLSFTGQFVAPTCKFTVNGGNPTNIGTYPNTYFNANASTPTTQIALVATGCTAGINTIHLYFSGVADAFNSHFFATNNGSGVKGVAIELLYNNQSIPIWANSSVNWVGFNPSQPTSTWNFWAHFYKTTGTITPGTINVPITINFTYN